MTRLPSPFRPFPHSPSAPADTSPWPRWLSLALAARYCSLSKVTILRYVKDGVIKGKKIGGKYILDRYSIDQFMDLCPEEEELVRSILGAVR